MKNQNARKADKARIHRLSQLYAALSMCNESIILCDDETELFPQICRAAVQHGGMMMAWIGLVDESSKLIKPVASFGTGTDYLREVTISIEAEDLYGIGPTGIAVRENRPYWCQNFMLDPATIPWRELAAQCGWRALASLTLLRKKVVVGNFTLYADTVDAFDADARKLLLEIADNLSFAMSNFAYEAERKLAIQLLEQKEQHFRAITETANDAIITTRANADVIVDWNLAAERIFGYKRDEIIGQSLLKLMPERFRERHVAGMARVSAGEVPHIIGKMVEHIGLRRDGSEFPLELSMSRWQSDRRLFFTAIIRDITLRKIADEQIQHYVTQLESAFMRTVVMATNLVEMRDPYTAGHERRVADIAAAIGGELGLDARLIEGLRVAGLLHDIGKISTPAEILAKTGKITAAEYMLIKEHPQNGYNVLKDVGFPWAVAEVAWQHHERMDGSGYPRGLKGDEILMEARIMSVADVVEAMASHRPYRPGHGIVKALEEIERGSGSAFDKEVAEACLRLFRKNGYVLPV